MSRAMHTLSCFLLAALVELVAAGQARADARDHDPYLLEVMGAYDSAPTTESLETRFPNLVMDLRAIALDHTLLSGVRMRAISTIAATLGDDRARSVVLDFAARESDGLVRRTAVFALARRWGPELDASERALVLRAAETPDETVQPMGLLALEHIAHDEATRALRRMATRAPKPVLRRMAARLLERRGVRVRLTPTDRAN